MKSLAAAVAAATVLAAPLAASGATLPVKAIKASSTLAEKDGETYLEVNMTDGKAGSYWAEGTPTAGMGTVLSVDFASEVTLSKIQIWNGCWQSADLWKRLYRVKDIELKYPDFSYERLTIPDGQVPQVVSLKAPKKLSNVKIVIKSVYDGTTFIDTAISEIRFLDDNADKVLTGLSATASSTLPAEKDNPDKEAYAPSKALDGFIDTYWAEGKTEKGPAGAGVGEWLQVNLATSAVQTLRLATGYGFDDKTFRQESRAAVVKAEFSDGTSRELALQDRLGYQDFDLGGKTLSWIRFTLQSVVDGTRWQDASIADVQLLRP